MKKLTTLLLLVFFSATVINAQQEEKKKFPIKLNGTIGLSLGAYKAFGIENRRDPFSYQFTSNINLRVFNMNIPVGALLGQQELPVLQPFNQIGFSPTYKWVKSHVGFRTMQFSPYTMNSHLFLGGGLEMKLPTKKGPVINIAGLYGRFRRAVEVEDAMAQGGVASYRRMGWGAKLGLAQRSNQQNKIAFILFKATDAESSIAPVANPEPDLTLLPAENLVLGFEGQYQLFKKIHVKAEYGTTGYTRDLRSEPLHEEDIPVLFKPFKGIFTPRLSTLFKDALNASVNYQGQGFTAGVQYERIDPGYITLGTYFFQNDLENITLNANLVLNQGKITIGGSVGRQKDNLDSEKSMRNQRLITSLNYTQMIGQKLNVNASFSNYSSAIKVVQEDLSDSLNLFQLSTNYNVSLNYLLGVPEDASSVFANVAYQVGNSRDEYRILEDETTFWMFVGGYRKKIRKIDADMTASLNFNTAETAGMKTSRVGPAFTLAKEILDKKMKLAYALNFTASIMDGEHIDNLLNNTASVNYQLTKRINTSLSIGHFYKNDLRPGMDNFSEIRGITTITLKI